MSVMTVRTDVGASCARVYQMAFAGSGRLDGKTTEAFPEAAGTADGKFPAVMTGKSESRDWMICTQRDWSSRLAFTGSSVLMMLIVRTPASTVARRADSMVAERTPSKGCVEDERMG